MNKVRQLPLQLGNAGPSVTGAFQLKRRSRGEMARRQG